MTIGALEAGGTKMVLAAFDETGKELERLTIPTEEPAVTMPPMQQFFDRWIPFEQRYFDALDVRNRCDLILSADD